MPPSVWAWRWASLLGPMLVAFGCKSEAAKQWGNFEGCMIGEPLQSGENVFLRLRGIQLAESTNGSQSSWPNRCSEPASSLYAALSEVGAEARAKRLLAQQLGCEQTCAFAKEGHPLPSADELWLAAKQAEFPSGDGSAPLPKPPLQTLNADRWPTLAPLGYRPVASKLGKHDRYLWLLLAPEKGRYSFCGIEGAKATCAPLDKAPDFHPRGGINLALDRDEPIVVGAVEGERVGSYDRIGYSPLSRRQVPVFGGAGKEVHTGLAFFPEARPPSPVPDAPTMYELRVQEVLQGQPKRSQRFEIPDLLQHPLAVADWMLYTAHDAKEGPKFTAHQLEPSGQLFKPEVTQLKGADRGSVFVCELPGFASVAYKPDTVRRQGVTTDTQVELRAYMLQGGAWTGPVDAEVPWVAPDFVDWVCGNGWGAFTWLTRSQRHVVAHEVRCSKNGCVRAQQKVTATDLKRPISLARYQEHVSIVYESTVGDVRALSAPFSTLPQAKPVLVFDTEVFGGVDPEGLETLASEQGVYVLVTTGGLRVLRLGYDGKVTPIKP